MRRYYFELTDENYNDLGAFIPDGSSKLAAIGKAKKWMQEHSVRRAILAVNSMKTDNLLDVIDIDAEITVENPSCLTGPEIRESEFHLKPEPCTPEVQKQSVLHKHHKPATGAPHDPCLRIYPEIRALKSVHVHYLMRDDSGRLVCQCCGRSFPSTPEGGLDKEQLLREMILR